MRRKVPYLALITTCVETSATLLLVLVRMGNAYAGYRAARSTVRHDENFDPDKDLHVKLLRRWLIAFEIIASLLFAGPLICLIVFHLFSHTGWTVLSNNISMITILAMSTLYTTRVISTVSRIREDQYKVRNHLSTTVKILVSFTWKNSVKKTFHLSAIFVRCEEFLIKLFSLLFKTIIRL